MSTDDRAQAIHLGIVLDGREHWTRDAIHALIGDEPIEVQRAVLLRMDRFSLDIPRPDYAKPRYSGLWRWGVDYSRDARWPGEGSMTPLCETHIDWVLSWLNAPAPAAPASQ